MKTNSQTQQGSTLVVTIVVVAALLVLLGAAVDYSTQLSRTTQRSRKTALAMEIADGHLETLFTNWRNIYRATWYTYGMNTGGTDYSVTGTNFFATSMYTPSVGATPIPGMTPAVIPPVIPTPAPSLFPTEANYQLTKYRIVAVDPMVDLDASENPLVETGGGGSGSYVPLSPNVAPPAAYGPNLGPYGYYYPYSYYYLAAADVTVPALAGNVTAKVRRIFEKKFDLPWRYHFFYMDDLELQPTSPLALSGPIHTNGSLYIGTSNISTSSWVEYGTDYVNGYSPNDSRYGSSATAPSFAKSDPALALSDCPPYQTAPYMPFGWNLNFNPLSANSNDGYREIIEQPAASPSPDPLASVRMYNQAALRVFIDSASNITAQLVTYASDGTATVTTPSNSQLTTIKGFVSAGTAANATLSSSNVFYDNRENTYIKAVNVDVFALTKAINNDAIPFSTGVMYISDTSGTLYNTDGTVKTAGTAVTVTYPGVSPNPTTTRRAIRLINGAVLPTNGLTIVSDNPIYIVGDYNVNPTADTKNNASYPTATPPSDSGTYTSPTVSGTQKYAAIMGDSITLLSKNWVDTNSTGSPTGNNRFGANTTVNACIVAGNTPSSGGTYGGGGENFVRYLEDWNKNANTFVFYGSMAQLYRPQQTIGAWSGAGSIYKAPALKWYYDATLLATGGPPGNLALAAYLQQQRWYQVY